MSVIYAPDWLTPGQRSLGIGLAVVGLGLVRYLAILFEGTVATSPWDSW